MKSENLYTDEDIIKYLSDKTGLEWRVGASPNTKTTENPSCQYFHCVPRDGVILKTIVHRKNRKCGAVEFETTNDAIDVILRALFGFENHQSDDDYARLSEEKAKLLTELGEKIRRINSLEKISNGAIATRDYTVNVLQDTILKAIKQS